MEQIAPARSPTYTYEEHTACAVASHASSRVKAGREEGQAGLLAASNRLGAKVKGRDTRPLLSPSGVFPKMGNVVRAHRTHRDAPRTGLGEIKLMYRTDLEAC